MNNIEHLECVYYPGPVPCDESVLTALCFVFDKIHFPGVYLPKGDYDRELLRDEITRLEEIDSSLHRASNLAGMLRFLEYRLPLDGILEYPSPRDSIFGQGDNEASSKLARLIYDVNYPPKENWEPAFETAHVKGLPESEEAVAYAGSFYYQAGAIEYATRTQLPILDDGSGLALPFRAKYKDNAQSLAAMLAIESVNLILPDLPTFTVQELVDFRTENGRELKAFRAAMLRYAKELNAAISDEVSLDEFRNKLKFLVDTEINPTLHDLNRDICNPNRPWHKRFTDGVKIACSITTGILTAGIAGQTVSEGLKNVALSEIESRGDKLETAKRNGLYYLLKAKKIGT